MPDRYRGPDDDGGYEPLYRVAEEEILILKMGRKMESRELVPVANEIMDFSKLGISESDIVLQENQEAVKFQFEYFTEFKKIQDEYSNIEINGIEDKENYKKASEGVSKARKLQITAEKFMLAMRDSANKFAKKCSNAEHDLVGKVDGFRLPLIARIQKIDQEIERIEEARIEERMELIQRWNKNYPREALKKMHNDEFADLLIEEQTKFEFAQKIDARKNAMWKLDNSISIDTIENASDDEFLDLINLAQEKIKKAEEEILEIARVKAEQQQREIELAEKQAQMETMLAEKQAQMEAEQQQRETELAEKQAQMEAEQQQRETELAEKQAQMEAQTKARERELADKELALVKAETDRLIAAADEGALKEWKEEITIPYRELGTIEDPNAQVLELTSEDSLMIRLKDLSFYPKLTREEKFELKTFILHYSDLLQNVG